MWTDERMLALDLETTSVDPRQARIVTAALAFVGGGRPTDSMEWLVNPGVEIPEEAAKIHGITTERVQAEGIEAGAAVREICSIIEKRAEGTPIIAFNARYDLTVLLNEAVRHGAQIDPASFLVVDPIVIDKHIDRYRKGSRRLEVTCQHYGVQLDGAHNASADAIAAARCAWVIATKGVVIRRVRNGQEAKELAALVAEWNEVRKDLVKLNEAQRRWAREQALSLAEHFISEGQHEDAAKVEGDWPFMPLAA